MPRPPDWDGLLDLKFITNYALIGCEPPIWLFVELSQPAAGEFLWLLFTPDWQDIGQAVFEPKQQRRRKPARHGRKVVRVGGVPDVSDLIGGKIRGHLNPYNALNFSATKKLFRLWNVYEGISFTAAILEKLTNVGFEGLWGIIDVDHGHCLDMQRLSRTISDPITSGGAGPPIDPIPLNVLNFTHGFFDNSFLTNCASADYTLGFQALVHNDNNQEQFCRLALQNIDTGEIVQTDEFTFAPGDTHKLEVHIDAKAGQSVSWGMGSPRFGFFKIIEAHIIAFSHGSLPWF